MENLNAERIKKGLECCSADTADCHNCPYSEFAEGNCFDNNKKDALSLINELTEENERLRAKWISVKDRLPKWNGLYLTFQDGKPNISNFDAQKHKFGVWWHYTPDGRYEKNYRFIKADGITHWMPVEVPKGE